MECKEHHTAPGHPLANRRILITRDRVRAEESARLVRTYGAEPVLFPCLEIHCLNSAIEPAVEALFRPGAMALFTSANGVDCVADMLDERFAPTFAGRMTAVVGKRTAAALEARGVEAAIVPETFSQEGVLAALEQHGLPESVVFFRAEEGREMLADALNERGVDVHLAAVYRTTCPTENASQIITMLQEHRIDAVLLGSPKAARFYVERIGDAALAGTPAIAAISRNVADCAAELGLQVQIVAKEASFASMLDGLEAHFAADTLEETGA